MSQSARSVVLITSKLAQFTVDTLGDSAEARWVDGPNRTELPAAVGDADALLVRSATTVSQEVLEATSDLKVVGRADAGPDNVDIDIATKHGVMVVNTPTSNIYSACEHTIALLLATARQLPATDASLCEGEWKRSSLKDVEIFGKTVGIVGFGHTGQLFAQRLTVFEINVIVHDPYVNPARVTQLGVEPAELEKLMARADFVTIHLPKTRGTAGTFDTGFLGKTKEGRITVNATHGGLVSEQALIDMVRVGNIRSTGFDVYATEPCTNSLLFDLPETVCTPYLDASAVEAQGRVNTDVARPILLALADGLVPDVVNVSGGTVDEEVTLWLELARELGLVAGGLLEDTPVAIKVTARGEPHTEDANVLGIATIRGSFSLMVEEPITFVNTPRIAEERGVTFTVETEPESVSHRPVPEVKVIGADGSIATIAGALIDLSRIEKIVRINGRGIDMRAQDRNLFPLYKDVPGALGCATTALGESGINIEAVALLPQEAGRTAILVLHAPKEVPEELVEKITKEVSATHALRLEPGQS